MIKKSTLAEYTESEFLELLELILETNGKQSDDVLDPLLEHFEMITEHPSGTDLIYWPETAEQGEPHQIIRIVKEWRLANGKGGFKPI